jgi:surface polysaccharide O-acyltransferase-like enzyme
MTVVENYIVFFLLFMSGVVLFTGDRIVVPLLLIISGVLFYVDRIQPHIVWLPT